MFFTENIISLQSYKIKHEDVTKKCQIEIKPVKK